MIVLSFLRSPLESPTNTTIKGLLWADLIRRSTGALRACGAAHPQLVSPELAGFWALLDRAGEPCAQLTAAATLALETRYGPLPRPQVDGDAGLHPVAERNLLLLSELRELLGTSVPPVPALAAEERVSALLGGEPVGSPLRGVLRAVLPHVDGCADVVVLHPARATGTFVRARDVLGAAGVRMHRIALAELEPAALATDLVGDADPDVLRLGLRHYFVGVLGKTGRRTLEPKLLRQSVHRAEQFLARQDAADEVSLQEFVTPHSVVDVYRLTTTLLGRRSPFSADALVRSLYL